MKKLLLNESELCRILNIKPNALLYAARMGVSLTRVKIGKFLLYDIDDIINWVESSLKFGATIPEELQKYEDEDVIDDIGVLSIALSLPYRYTFYKVRKGIIPSKKLNGKYLFKIREIKSWINSLKEKSREGKKQRGKKA